jgi:hypothetical protein
LDYDDKHNLNEQQDSTTNTNSTKQSEKEIARLKGAVGQWKSKYFLGLLWTIDDENK